MQKQKEVTINGQNYTLQRVSPTWYISNMDRYGMTGGDRKDTTGYMDSLFRNTVIAPAAVTARGLAYFDDAQDIDTPMLLMDAIDRFLRTPPELTRGHASSAPSA